MVKGYALFCANVIAIISTIIMAIITGLILTNILGTNNSNYFSYIPSSVLAKSTAENMAIFLTIIGSSTYQILLI